MDFAFSSDQQLLKNSARAFLDEHCKPATVRAVCSGSVRATLALLDGELSWARESIATQAERSRDGWKLSGRKPFVPWAHVADVMLVPARTPEGLTLFLVDPHAAGITHTPVTGMDLATRWVNVTLDSVDVAADDVLGWPGNGEAQVELERLLRMGAVGAAAQMLGAARRCLDMAGGEG